MTVVGVTLRELSYDAILRADSRNLGDLFAVISGFSILHLTVKRISYDYTNLMADVVGERGIRDEDLDTIAPRVRAAVEDPVDLAGDPEVRFPNLPEQDWSELLTYAQEAQRRFEHLVVLGIGGSALGARAVYSALVRPHSGKHRDGRERPGPTLHVIDNVDLLTLVDLLDELNLDKTLFNVVTKSGNTIETMSAFFLVRERLIADFGLSGYRERVVCTTDPARGALRQIVKQDHLRSFEVPGVGGRFSVLTAVGLLPLAICGLDVTALLKGARDARDNAFEPTVETNIAAMFAATQVLLYDRQVHDVVLMPYSDALIDSAAWFVQLWAESLAKRVPGTDSVVGPTPIAARGATDQHSQLQLYMEGPATKNIVFIEVAQEGEPTVVPNVRAQSEGLGAPRREAAARDPARRARGRPRGSRRRGALHVDLPLRRCLGRDPRGLPDDARVRHVDRRLAPRHRPVQPAWRRARSASRTGSSAARKKPTTQRSCAAPSPAASPAR